MNKKNVLICFMIALVVIVGAFAIKKFTNRDIKKIDDLVSAYENEIRKLDLKNEDYNKNLFDRIQLNTSATGDVEINAENDTIMAFKIENRCIKKYHNNNVSVDTFKNDDDCTISTPSRCFETSENNGELSISRYLCGSTFELQNSSITFNADGEYLNVVIPSSIDGKKVTSIAPFAFSPYTTKKGMDGAYIADKDAKVGIKYVDIPSSIKTIGTYAFSSNILENIYIKDGIENIKSEAFSRNLLSGVISLSDSTIEVANYAFSDNNIREFQLGKNTKKLGQAVVYNNANLNSIIVNDNIEEESPYWPIIITGQYDGDISTITFSKD